MTATELAHGLSQRSEEVCRRLLPGGSRKGKEWEVGSLKGEAGGSMKVCLEGEKAGVWCDFATGEKGDLIGLWQAARGLSLQDACKEAEELLGVAPVVAATPSSVWASLQHRLRKGTVAELQALAAIRKIPNIAGLELATQADQLWFADVWDESGTHPSWIITDGSRLNAQARRMDGGLWHGDQKAKTLKGCKGSWPIGIHGINGKDIALVEGGPDFLAAWHLIWAQGKKDTIRPVAMLGAGMAIHPDALPNFLQKTVTLFPHKDASGEQAAKKWSLQLTASTIQTVDLPLKDLNDWVSSGDEIPDVFGPKPPEWLSRLVTLASKPVEPVTRLFLAGKPIATPGNLVSLISKAKTGKTAEIGAVVAAIVAAHYDRHGLDTLGFTAPHTKEAVVLIDTEQSPFDSFICHQRAMARASQQTDVPWLMHLALVGYEAAKLRRSLVEIMKKAKEDHGGVFILILDGVADFVLSVNDEAECNEFISWLRSIAVEYDCPILCVIHSNEAQKSGDDGRGHLGKQLTRKSESNLLLKKVGEVTTVTSEKQRKAPITEKDGISFRWSDEHQRHVSCVKAAETPKGGRPKHSFDTFVSIFPRTADKAMTKQVLLRYAQDLAEIKETAFRDLLHQATQDGSLVRTPRATGFVYHLNTPPI